MFSGFMLMMAVIAFWAFVQTMSVFPAATGAVAFLAALLGIRLYQQAVDKSPKN